jgi:PhnB protein
MLVKAHFTFNGNADDALDFYKKVFNGKVKNVVRCSDMKNIPQFAAMDEKEEYRIVNSCLEFEGNTINICDQMPNAKIITGNNIMMDIVLKTEVEVKQIFNSLAESGQVTLPLTAQDWTPNFGMLIDKFGIRWNIMQL